MYMRRLIPLLLVIIGTTPQAAVLKVLSGDDGAKLAVKQRTIVIKEGPHDR